MQKILYAGCLGLSVAILSQFTVKMCASASNCKKITKTPILGVQVRSRSSMLKNLKSPSPVLVMISSMSYPSATVFTLYGRILAKQRLFLGGEEGTFLWRFRSKGTPSRSPRGTKFCHDKLEFLWQPIVEITWSCIASIWHNTAVWQTDGHLDDDQDARSILLWRV